MTPRKDFPAMVITQLVHVVVQSILTLQPALAPSLPAGPELVPFEQLVAKPDVYLGRTVSTYVQLHSELETWDAGMTRFLPSHFAGCRVWSDGQLPWRQEDYVAPAGILFLRRDSAEMRDFVRAVPHQRWLVRCTVRELFGGETWIEIDRIIPARRSIPEGTVLHAIRAAQLVDRHAWSLASGELERALAAPLPEHASVVLEATLQACRDQRTAIEAGIRHRPHKAREASARVNGTLRGDH
tara:strand:- start:7497 stop:8219 length:723 start_codon:yes stop_codon:yes gene_type:complete